MCLAQGLRTWYSTPGPDSGLTTGSGFRRHDRNRFAVRYVLDPGHLPSGGLSRALRTLRRQRLAIFARGSQTPIRQKRDLHHLRQRITSLLVIRTPFIVSNVMSRDGTGSVDAPPPTVPCVAAISWSTASAMGRDGGDRSRENTDARRCGTRFRRIRAPFGQHPFRSLHRHRRDSGIVRVRPVGPGQEGECGAHQGAWEVARRKPGR
jgi:hypothetical protein